MAAGDTRDGGQAGRKRATLKTIADLTGLSQSTVSLSLRGGAALKEETRRRVAEAAASVGYVPDRAGVRLRTGKTNVIALVLDRDEDSIDFARHMIQGIGEAIHDTRYHLNVTPDIGDGKSIETVRYILENRTADGLILTHTMPRDPRVELLMRSGLPFVTHGRTGFGEPHPYHDFHSEAFARLSVRRLADLGCRSVMLAIGGEITNNHRSIVTTFERAAADLGMSARVEVHPRKTAPAMFRKLGCELGIATDRPDGIVCDSEMRAVCILAGLADKGVQVPRDVKMVCKQTSAILPALHPEIDTVHEDIAASGAELTRLLLRRISGDAPEALRTLAEPTVDWKS